MAGPHPSSASSRRSFHALDGLRGVAALFVAMRHTAFFHSLGIPGGYLAVDLFFVLSGFVIAHAYEARLERGLSTARFLMLRYLRLWPVYALGAALGLGAALLPGVGPRLSPAEAAHTAPLALLMLPGPMIRPMLYPANSVAWSLGLELLANGLFGLFWRPLRKAWALGLIMAVWAAGLIAAVAWFGKLDIGFQWRDAIGGLPRVLFSFTAGLAVHRLWRAGRFSLRLPAWLWVAPLPILLWAPQDMIVYPLICAVVVFPALVLAAASAPQPGPRATRLFAALGAASYPLYALHKPAGEIAGVILHAAPAAVRHAPLLVGVPYLAVLVLACIALERWLDRPARGALARAANGAADALRARADLLPAGGLLRRL